MILNLFYEEPDPDRWIFGDRYPRQIIRKFFRPPPWISGHRRVFLNLLAGLERLGVQARVNDYSYAKKHPNEVACIIGKPNVLDKIRWKNPILLGASLFSHPCDEPHDFADQPVQRILVPGEWMTEMWSPFYGDQVHSWPVGINTDLWAPVSPETKDIDFLIYDKIRWDYEAVTSTLIDPIIQDLEASGYSFARIRYGQYREKEYHSLLARCRAMVFLCEHESQGIAYQEALSCDVPILAWDRGGYWQDPNYYPHRVQYGPVSSVPYWDKQCGKKFTDASDFSHCLAEFWANYKQGQYTPRQYILDNLTLEKSAQQYLDHLQAIQD